ncbi:hypothetical protein KDL45_01860 [bacterium]|nr:hypothetical protein [bacterium]
MAVGLGLIGLLVVGLIVAGWILVRPWVAMPEGVDPVAVEARFQELSAQYATAFDPAGKDNRDVWKLSAKAGPAFEAVLGDRPLFRGGCDRDVGEAEVIYRSNRAELSPMATAYHELMADGLVLGDYRFYLEEGEEDPDVDIPNFVGLRYLFMASMIDARHALADGDTEAAMQRMDDASQAVAGLADSRELLVSMMSIAFQHIWYEVLAETMSLWPSAELAHIEALLQSEPSHKESARRALERAVIFSVENLHLDNLEHFRDDRYYAPEAQVVGRLASGPAKGLLAAWLERERTLILAWTFEGIDAAGDGREWEPAKRYPDTKSVLASIMLPNAGSLIGKGMESDQANAAMLQALRNERAYRYGEGSPEFVVPFGDGGAVEVKRDGGCVRWN